MITDEYAWMAQAKCKGLTNLFYFDDPHETQEKAKAICATCSVCEVCLEFALVTNEYYGVWGGTSEKQRRRLRAQRRREVG